MPGDVAIGRYTGLTAAESAQQNSLNRYNQDFTQTTNTGPQNVNTNTNSAQQGVTSGFQLNTTPDILEALQNFIAQMTDRPAISQQELDAKAPLAVQTYGPSGWYWKDPLSGRSFYTKAEADTFNSQQMVQRQQLIQQSGIIKGGTAEQRAVSDARLLEIDRNRATQGKYSKEAAFADAQGLSAYFNRVLMEQQLPGILRGAEGAGTSQGSMRALLQTRATEVTAEQASKLGLEAASAYGGINNQLAATLEALTRQDPNSISEQLLQALNIGKGIQTSGTQVQNQTGQQRQIQDKSAQTEKTVKDFQGPSTTPGTPLTQQPYVPTYQSTPQLSSASGTGYVTANDPYESVQFNNTGTGGGQENYSFYGGDEQFIGGEE